MKVCVTGGAGFIGSHLVDQLAAQGHEIVVLDDLSTGKRENLAGAWDAVRLIEGDLRDIDAVAEACRGAEAVFHLGALGSVPRSMKAPRVVTDINLGGTLNVLEAARDAGVRRVLFSSSSSVYGDTEELPKHEGMALRPRSPYAASKCAAELYMAAYRESYGLETVVVRFFNVYGARQRLDTQYGAVIPLFIDAMMAGRPPRIQGDGGQTRDFTYVQDVVDALVGAAQAPGLPPGPCNLGGGGRTSVLELARMIGELVGFEGEPEFVPPRPGDVRDSMADSRRAAEWMQWSTQVPLREGLRLTVEAVGAETRA